MMVNSLDPLTTEPIVPTPLDLSNRLDFLALQDKVLAPFARNKQADTQPAAAAPDKVEGIWNDFDPQIMSRWSLSVSSGGAVTLRDGVTATPGWSLGDSVVVAKVLKLGQIVRIKIIVTHGTNKLYGNASVALVGGFPQVIGDYGNTSFVLPYLPHSAGHSGFATGIQTGTVTKINASNVTRREALYLNGSYLLFGSTLSTTPSFFNQAGYNGRVALTYMDPPNWNPGPAVYYAAAPGSAYAVQGEIFTFFMKYHTDA